MEELLYKSNSYPIKILIELVISHLPTTTEVFQASQKKETSPPHMSLLISHFNNNSLHLTLLLNVNVKQ